MSISHESSTDPTWPNKWTSDQYTLDLRSYKLNQKVSQLLWSLQVNHYTCSYFTTFDEQTIFKRLVVIGLLLHINCRSFLKSKELLTMTMRFLVDPSPDLMSRWNQYSCERKGGKKVDIKHKRVILIIIFDHLRAFFLFYVLSQR